MSASTSAGARAPVRVRCAAVSVAVACSNGCSDRRSAFRSPKMSSKGRAPLLTRAAAVSVAVACSKACRDRRKASGLWASMTCRSGTLTAWPISSAAAALRFAARRFKFFSSSSTATLAPRRFARSASSAALGACGSCRSLPVARGARARGRAGGSAATTAPRRSAGRLPCRVSCCSARAVRSTDRVRPRRMIILGSMLARSLRSSSMQDGVS